MQRRQADDRIGTFSTAFWDFHSRQPRMESYAVLRWRLVPSHKEGTLLVPKQPIVFYLDPATPKVYQPYILDGVGSGIARLKRRDGRMRCGQPSCSTGGAG